MGVPSIIRQDPLDSQNADQAMVLRMIDWRGCSVVEYVPERVSGQPSFLNRRIQLPLLVGWLNAGSSVEDFARAFRVDMDTLMVAVRYLQNSPPVHVVDLAVCPVVESNEDGAPAFRGTGFPVEALFNYIKSGRTAKEFSDTYDLDDEQVRTVLAYANADPSP